jgi:hypothetical protein
LFADVVTGNRSARLFRPDARAGDGGYLRPYVNSKVLEKLDDSALANLSEKEKLQIIDKELTLREKRDPRHVHVTGSLPLVANVPTKASQRLPSVPRRANECSSPLASHSLGSKSGNPVFSVGTGGRGGGGGKIRSLPSPIPSPNPNRTRTSLPVYRIPASPCAQNTSSCLSFSREPVHSSRSCQFVLGPSSDGSHCYSCWRHHPLGLFLVRRVLDSARLPFPCFNSVVIPRGPVFFSLFNH